MRRAPLVALVAISVGCVDDLSTIAGAVSSYSNCVGGCPDDHACIGWYDQGYCTPLCSEHDECRTGCCATASSGTRACGPMPACLNECAWASRLDCVETVEVFDERCGSLTVTVTHTNRCTSPVRLYSCITERGGTWDCRPDDGSGGLAPDQAFTHQVCDSGGYYYLWATSFATFEEHACPWPLP